MKFHFFMRKNTIVAEIMNYTVSGYVYFVAFTLVVYMVSSLVTGVYELIIGFTNMPFSIQAILSAPQRSLLEHELLHTIAFTIVLVKAYKILIAYAQTRHINLKFLVEISIIAPTIELVFNIRNYSIEVSILFAVIAFCNLIVYLYFYKTLRLVSSDYERDKKAHLV